MQYKSTTHTPTLSAFVRNGPYPLPTSFMDYPFLYFCTFYYSIFVCLLFVVYVTAAIPCVMVNIDYHKIALQPAENVKTMTDEQWI